MQFRKTIGFEVMRQKAVAISHHFLAAFVVAALVAPSSIQAQQYLGTLSGGVSDSTGAKIVGADVTARDVTTKFETKAITNGSGEYTIPFLTPDTYTITVAAPGFGAQSRTDIVLTAGGIQHTDFSLKAGAATDQVVVTADSEQLNTASAELNTTLSTMEVTDLPNVGRNPFVLATLAANVYSGNYMQGKASGFTNPFSGTAVQILVNGSSGHNRLTLDGIPDDPAERLSGAGYTGFVPSPEAVQEVKVQTGTYDAQYGHGNGVVTNTVLRAGSDKYHGSAYFTFRDTYLDANTYERTATQNTAPAGIALTPRVNDTWTQPGFVFSGPLKIPHIVKGDGKTFFMVAYERIQLHQPLPYQSLVPTTSGGITGLGEVGGDFSSLCTITNGVCTAGIQIYDPTSVVSGNGNRTPFAGNIIPSGRFQGTAGAALLKMFPAPNSNFSNTVNYISSDTSEPNKYFSVVTRVDHSFSDRHKINATYFKDILNQLEPNEGFPGIIGPSTGTAGGDGYTVYRNNEGGSVDDVFAISPTLVVDARFGVIYHPFGLVYPGSVFNLASIGISATGLPYQSFPNTTASDSYAGLAGGADGQISEDTLGSTSLLIAKTIQKHSLRVGFDGNMSRYNVQNPGSGLGNFVFNRQFTQENSSGQTGANCPAPNCTVGNDTTSGNAIAAMLLGYPSSGTYTNQIAYALEQKYIAFYGQDDWRVSDKLTINAGLRWDYESPFTERYNRLNAPFCITCVNPLQSSVSGITLNGGLTFVGTSASPSRFAVPQKFANIQPRFGAAYQVAPKLVLRGGFGLIYYNTLESPLGQGFSQSTAYVAQTNNVYPTNSISAPFPAGVQLPTGNSLGLSTQLGQAVTAPDPNHVQPKMWQWSTSLQIQLPAKVAVQLAYAGNRVSQLEINKSINNLPASFMGTSAQPLASAQISALTGTVANPLAGKLPGSSLNAATVPAYWLDVPFPEFTGVTTNFFSAGSASYNSLAITVIKQMSHNFEVQGNFTLAKIMDQTVYLNPQATTPFRFQDQNPNLTSNIFGTYHFSKLDSKPAIERLALGGWQLQGVLRAYNGPLVPAPGSSTGIAYNAGSNSGTTWTELQNPKSSYRSYSRYFNTCYENSAGALVYTTVSASGAITPGCDSITSTPALRANPQFTLATTGPYLNIRELVHPLMDVSVFKRFIIHEASSFELRGEFFNVMNTPNFGAPGTTPGATSYGVVTLTQVNDPRLVQLTARINF